MPTVMAQPRRQSNDDLVTEFIDTAGTSATTYTFPNAQNFLRIENKGVTALTLSVGAYTGVPIAPGQAWENEVDYSSFIIQSASGTQQFNARSIIHPVTAVKSVDEVYVERKSSTRYWVWIKRTGSKWLIYEVINHIDAAINVNVWRINDVFLGDLGGNTPVIGVFNVPGFQELGGKTLSNQISPISTGSQWEYAIQPNGSPDFFGGFHGDELVQSAAFFLNGRSIGSPGAFPSSVLRRGERFEMVQKTICYNPLDGTTKMGDMFVRHIFTPEGLRIKWKFVWAASITVNTSYGGMLPTKRNQTNGIHFARFADDLTVNDVSLTPHSRPGMNTTSIEVYNNGNSLSARLTLDVKFFNNYAASVSKGIWVTDDANYNKVYPTRVHSSTTASVTAGDVWECDAFYEFFLPEPI